MALNIKRITIVGLAIALMMAGVASSGWAGSITITSPSAGSIVYPGQTIVVTVQPGTGTVLQKVTGGFATLNQIPQIIQNPPYEFSVQVPSDQIGTLSITALALDTLGNTLQTSISVLVMPNSPVTSIKINADRILFSSADGSLRSVTVSATLQDGTSAYVNNSPDTQYVSSNPKVATVNSTGQVQPVAPGTSNLVVKYGGFTATVPVMVGVFPMKGDLNGDGAVDQKDLAILLKALNTPATGPGDPRDLNGNGRIDALDARILVTLCSRSGCATQ